MLSLPTGLYISLPAKELHAEPVILLLAFSPLQDETAFTAENHKKFILATMESYELKLENLVCLIGDNCSTNTATANKMNVPLLGCRSHRFNLAVEANIKKYLDAEV